MWAISNLEIFEATKERLPEEVIYIPDTAVAYEKKVFEPFAKHGIISPWLIYGPSGSGKTTITIHLIEKYKHDIGKDKKLIYVKCSQTDKLKIFLQTIHAQLLGYIPPEVSLYSFIENAESLGYKRIYLFLDEADYLVFNRRSFGPNFIHSLMSAEILKPVLITNQEIRKHLRNDTNSRLSANVIDFDYSVEDLKEILLKRLNYAVEDKMFSKIGREEFAQKVAELAFNNFHTTESGTRQALMIAKIALFNAERSERPVIEQDIKAGFRRTLVSYIAEQVSKMPTQALYALRAIIKNYSRNREDGWATLIEAYNLYKRYSNNPVSNRQFRNYALAFERLGLLALNYSKKNMAIYQLGENEQILEMVVNEILGEREKIETLHFYM